MKENINAVGLDVGSSRVRCVIGEAGDGGKMNIVGIGEAESRGLRRGIVTGAEAAAEAIRKAINEAERVSGLEAASAVVNLSGEHFRGENKAGVVAVAGAGRMITEDDVSRAVESASAMQLPAGWEIFSRLPQEFIIDGQDGITEPVGMTGARLESLVHIVIGPSAGRQNLEKAVRRAGLDVERLMLEPLAAAFEAFRAWRSVLATMKSTPLIPASIILLTAFPPPPPTPITFIRAPVIGGSSMYILIPPLFILKPSVNAIEASLS